MAQYTDKWDKLSDWTDGNGFEYDTAPDNIIIIYSNAQQKYELTNHLPDIKPEQYNSWLNWIDKAQPDYRFLQASDYNATATLFPNVDDPWMFTEYVFQGHEDTDTVIEPPLYDDKNFSLLNPDEQSSGSSTSSSTLSGYKEEKIISERGWQNDDYYNLTDEQYKTKYGYTKEEAPNLYPTHMEGVKFYRAKSKVECVKWGQHGNIPPKTLNMTAPKNWIDPETLGKVIPVVKATMGFPVYAINFGTFYRIGRREYIHTLSFPDDLTLVLPEPANSWEKKYSYLVTTTGGVKQPQPRYVSMSDEYGYEVIYMGGNNSGDLIHNGCEFFKGENGTAECTAYPNLNDVEKATLNLDPEKCPLTNEDCPYFIKKPDQIEIGFYEGVASTTDQYSQGQNGYTVDQAAAANALLTTQTGLPMADMFSTIMAYGLSKFNTDKYREQGDTETRLIISYEIREEPLSPKIVERPTRDQFDKGAYVVRGTGQMGLDKESTAKVFNGFDNFMYDDMNQISYHRWLVTVLHCQDCRYCNNKFGNSMNKGYESGKIANVGGEGDYCRYWRDTNHSEQHYGVGCPYSTIPKRAYEFFNAVNKASSLLFNVVESWLSHISSLPMNPDDYEQWIEKVSESLPDTTEHYLLLSKTDDSVYFGGIDCGNKKDFTNHYIVCKFTVRKFNQDTGVEYFPGDTIPVDTVIRYELNKIYVYYQPYNLEGDKIYHNGKEWFLELERKYVKPSKLPIYIENEEKFVGGYHPQYKDISKMGAEFIQELDNDMIRDAMGDLGVGDPDYEGIQQPKVLQGYWIDESGEWIVDGREIGEDKPIAPTNSRVGAPRGGIPVCISIKKQNTTIDPVTMDRRSPITIRCEVLSNDTRQVIEDLQQNPPIVPDPDHPGSPFRAIPRIMDIDALPRERDSAYCSVCDMTLHVKWVDTVCPWCGNKYQLRKMKHFLRVRAIGKISVWGMPGMIVRKDAYYWKNPTIVNNALVAQIRFKLGDLNDDGGGYKGGANKSSELFNRYQDGIAYYKPGVIPGTEEDENVGWSGMTSAEQKTYFSYNTLTPKIPLDEEDFKTDGINDQLIAPYVSDDGLKMVTMNHVRALRNTIEPTMAYVIGGVDNTDYERHRASFNNRLEFKTLKYWYKKPVRVTPQILAANNIGWDAFVQYWSGDPDQGAIRDYYPPGCSWWLMKGLIGGRTTPNKGSKVHMDKDGSPGLGYYGDTTLSRCFFFLHGELPLDKEILKAYAIIQPGEEPTRYPLGKGWNGVYHYDHYHAFVTNHEGKGNHLHGDGGDGHIYDDNGDVVTGSLSNEESYSMLEYKKKHPVTKGNNYTDSVNDDNDNEFKTLDTGDYLPWLDGSPSYESQYDVNPSSIFRSVPYYWDDGWYGESDPWGYISWGGIGTDIVQNFTEDRIWKELTTDEFQNALGYYQAECELFAENAENNSHYTFYRWADIMLRKFLPHQTQFVPGYFNFSGMNSAFRMSKTIDMQKPEYDDTWHHSGQIVYQAREYNEYPVGEEIKLLSEDVNQRDIYQGNTVAEEAGAVTKIIDITSIVQECYNKRIEREYTVETGKTFEEVRDTLYQQSAWAGTNIDSDDMRLIQDDMSFWNDRDYEQGYGYRLDNNNFPEVDSSGNLKPVDVDGDKYPLRTSDIMIVSRNSETYEFTTTEHKYKITLNYLDDNGDDQQASVEDSFGTSSSTGVNVANSLETTLKNAVSDNKMKDQIKVEYTDNRVRIQIKPYESGLDIAPYFIGIKNIIIEEITDNAYGVVGLSVGSYWLQTNRMISVTSYLEPYHPQYLSSTDNIWYFETLEDKKQSFTVDLIQTPIESYRRNWRYKKGETDCTNVYCPNTQCRTNTDTLGPYTVGVWAKKNQKSFSVNNVSCPACGADLSQQPGVVKTDGDSVYTYSYKDLMEENVFITRIKCDITNNNEVLEKYKNGFSVLVHHNETDLWETIYTCSYNKTDNKFYWVENGHGVSGSIPKNDFVFTEPKRIRYVKILVDPIPRDIEHNGDSGVIDNTNNQNAYIIKGRFIDDSLAELKLLLSDTAFVEGQEPEETQNIKERVVKSNEVTGSNTKLYLNYKLDDVDYKYWRFVRTEFRGGIGDFKAYGFAYNKHDMTIMPLSNYESYVFEMKKRYRLKESPTQILGVYAARNEEGGLLLTEVNHPDDVKWQTVLLKYNETEYDKIIGGTWCYDYVNMKIIVPDKNQDNKSMILFEKNFEESQIKKSYLPTQIIIEYWFGMGSGLTLEALAKGSGPSYQVEKEAIQEIVSTMPDNGLSVRLPDNDKNYVKREIPWLVYNHTMMTLQRELQELEGFDGTFKKPVFRGTELGDQYDDYDTFSDLFGKNCDKISGYCKGEITFYGKPNSILSGQITVKAPKYIKNTYQFGAEGEFTLYERTGGLKHNGFLIGIKLKPSETRKTLAWKQPMIVIYARERSPAEELNNTNV